MPRQRLIPILAAAALFPTLASADPGELTAVEIGSQGNNLGYFEYLPAAYDESEEWPLLIFLSGIGENGNGMLPDGQDSCVSGPNYPDGNLCRNLRHGPQNLIYRQQELGQTGLWDDTQRPFVVIAPQNPAPLFAMAAYDAARLDTFFDYVLDTYAIDERRVYVTAMSMGGYSSMLYLQENPHRLAALAIMPGIAATGEIPVCDLVEQNIWVFHGENDTNPFSPFGPLNFVRQFRACPNPHPYPRATVYAGAGHDVWTRTINPSDGMNDPVLESFVAGGNIDLDPYDIDVYTWLLQHDRPSVSAGSDLQVTTADDPLVVTASTIDDDTVSYTWSQVDGTAVELEDATEASLVLRNLGTGTYTFSVLAVDSDGQFDRDDVTVTVTEAPDDSGGDEADETGVDAGETSDGDPSAGDASAGESEDTGTPVTAGEEDGSTGDSNVDPSAGETDDETDDGDGPAGGTEGDGPGDADASSAGTEAGGTEGPGEGGQTDTEAASSDSGDEGDDTGSQGTGTGGASGTGGATGGGASGTGGATGGTTFGPGVGSDESSGGSAADDDGGCNCSTTQSPGRGGAASLLGLFGLMGLRRRRFGRR